MKVKSTALPLAVILALVAWSCGKALSGTEGGSHVILDAAISSRVETRGIVSGTAFPKNATMGLFVCRHEAGTPTAFVEYSSRYNNLQATQTNDTLSSPVWSYRYGGTGTSFSTLFLLMPQTGEKAADFYAYAPFVSGVTSPRSIPFNLQTGYNSLPDLMYASENRDTTNRNKRPDGSLIRLGYHFEHKLVWLQCRFYLKNDDQSGTLGPGSPKDSENTCRVDSIKIRRSSGAATPLYVRGAFDAIDGNFLDGAGDSTLVAADSLSVTYKEYTYYVTGGTRTWYPTFGTKGNTYGLLLVPGEYLADGDYELVFTIDGKELETTYPIRVADVTHSGGTTVGFREGYRYTFTFTYDNYQHISIQGTQIDSDGDWTVFPEQKDFII